jgi:hypothetical protein
MQTTTRKTMTQGGSTKIALPADWCKERDAKGKLLTILEVGGILCILPPNKTYSDMELDDYFTVLKSLIRGVEREGGQRGKLGVRGGLM